MILSLDFPLSLEEARAHLPAFVCAQKLILKKATNFLRRQTKGSAKEIRFRRWVESERHLVGVPSPAPLP